MFVSFVSTLVMWWMCVSACDVMFAPMIETEGTSRTACGCVRANITGVRNRRQVVHASSDRG